MQKSSWCLHQLHTSSGWLRLLDRHRICNLRAQESMHNGMDSRRCILLYPMGAVLQHMQLQLAHILLSALQ